MSFSLRRQGFTFMTSIVSQYYLGQFQHQEYPGERPNSHMHPGSIRKEAETLARHSSGTHRRCAGSPGSQPESDWAPEKGMFSEASPPQRCEWEKTVVRQKVGLVPGSLGCWCQMFISAVWETGCSAPRELRYVTFCSPLGYGIQKLAQHSWEK